MTSAGISKRLSRIASFVSTGAIVCDIGTDHGYVPIYLIKNKISPFVIASDIGEGPLKTAEKNIEAAGLIGSIKLVKSDGFKDIRDDRFDTAVIAGMGGELIAEILSNVPDHVSELVLSPHSFWGKARAAMTEKGFEAVDEVMICEDGKYYVIIKAARAARRAAPDETELEFGPVLLKNKDEILLEYLKKNFDKYSAIRAEIKDFSSAAALEKKLSLIADALKRIS